MNADVAQMNVPLERARLNHLSRVVIGAAQKVSSTLGYGFLEKVYENALCLELRRRELQVHQQIPLQVAYEGVIVGDYIPDMLVEDSLIVEIKAVRSIERAHRQQCLNYLRASNLRLGLLLNFGRAHLEVGRIVSGF
jgi:GxxExxY protein